MIQSLTVKIRKLKDKIKDKLDERNQLAQSLLQPEISYEELLESNSELWDRLGDITMDQLIAFLHWRRIHEEIEYIQQDVTRFIGHVTYDVSRLSAATVVEHPKLNPELTQALEAVRDSFIEKLELMKGDLERN
jgi:hypothetical protein